MIGIGDGRRCKTCNGSGVIVVDEHDGVNVLDDCPDCLGSGDIEEAKKEVRLTEAWDNRMKRVYFEGGRG
jgi:DnaJ-class molecular chaperone